MHIADIVAFMDLGLDNLPVFYSGLNIFHRYRRICLRHIFVKIIIRQQTVFISGP